MNQVNGLITTAVSLGDWGSWAGIIGWFGDEFGLSSGSRLLKAEYQNICVYLILKMAIL